jgi:hypothetical protein
LSQNGIGLDFDQHVRIDQPVNLLHDNAAACMNILTRQPPRLFTDDERHYIGNVLGRPSRFKGDIWMPIWRNWSVIMPVSVKPGETVLTVMPRGASSCANPFVYCSSGPLLPR